MSKIKKSRHWAFVIYPESMPENWQEIIQESGLAIAVSPLHDKDINPDGEIKKEHYHIIASYDGPTTYNNVLEFTKKLNGTIPIDLQSVRGMYRYHLHLDNPEKYQYDDRDRHFFNGFDISSVNELTKTEVNKCKKEILIFIEDNDIVEYSDLLNTLIQNDMTNLLDVATSHTILFNTFITSRRNKQLPIIDIMLTSIYYPNNKLISTNIISVYTLYYIYLIKLIFILIKYSYN